MTVRHPVIHLSCQSPLSAPSGHLPLGGGRLTIRESRQLIRPSDIASFRHPERSELSFVRKAVFRKRGTEPKDRGDAAIAPLSPSYQSTHSTFLPPSFGRRCPEGAEVGSRCGIFTHGDTNPASLRSSAPSRGRGENDSRASPFI